ncbi:MAG: hypothetical protein M5U09_01125 [Gammaproteobacteria bacterium]|nr:hypothetical protein [Gammaproteobacteria bacterium]
MPIAAMEYTATNLKADKFTFPVLELFSADTDRIAEEVGNKVDQAPTFFRNAPIVIDLKSLPADEDPRVRRAGRPAQVLRPEPRGDPWRRHASRRIGGGDGTGSAGRGAPQRGPRQYPGRR